MVQNLIFSIQKYKMNIPSLIADFQKQLQDIEHSDSDIIKESKRAIILCRETLSCLKKEIIDKEFDTIDQEIEFFKTTKQIPLAHLIYYLECYTFETQFPVIDKKQQEKYISKSRHKIQSFFTRHLDFVNYIEQEHNHLDTWYFTRRKNGELKIIPTQDYTIEIEFNTSHDILLGKLLAYKRFIKYLEVRFEKQEQKTNIESLSKHYDLKWTSSKTALTELIYALYYSRAINHGNTDKKDIAMAFQKLFNFELGDFYKTLSEIKSRKKSRTRFLDELSINFVHEMEKSDI